jgi:O6-methylguanine-DNA--protein-cysteine methyltransferase
MVEQMAIGSLETPIGTLWMACSERGVSKLVFPREGARAAVDRWLAAYHPSSTVTTMSAMLARTEGELHEYFAGTRDDFTVPLDLRGSAFQRRVWQALGTIPYGRTVSYGSLARTLGVPTAARAVGTACGANPVPIIAP